MTTAKTIMTTAKTKKVYYVLSGEKGCVLGHWQRVQTTPLGIKQRLGRERCGGDRWALACGDAYEVACGGFAAYNVESGETVRIPQELVHA